MRGWTANVLVFRRLLMGETIDPSFIFWLMGNQVQLFVPGSHRRALFSPILSAKQVTSCSFRPAAPTGWRTSPTLSPSPATTWTRRTWTLRWRPFETRRETAREKGFEMLTQPDRRFADMQKQLAPVVHVGVLVHLSCLPLTLAGVLSAFDVGVRRCVC